MVKVDVPLALFTVVNPLALPCKMSDFAWQGLRIFNDLFRYNAPLLEVTLARLDHFH